MIRLGLCSITFRKLTPAAILALARQANLDAIEWGGDVHVPHGDVDTARNVRRVTRDEGLRDPLVRLLLPCGPDPERFEGVLSTAVAARRTRDPRLGRQWSDPRKRPEQPGTAWLPIPNGSHPGAGRRPTHRLRIYGNTLTDTDEAAIRLLTDRQPPSRPLLLADARVQWSLVEHLEGLLSVLPWLEHVHVQACRLGTCSARHAGRCVAEDPGASPTGRDHTALLELVRDDSPEHLADAATLRSL